MRTDRDYPRFRSHPSDPYRQLIQQSSGATWLDRPLPTAARETFRTISGAASELDVRMGWLHARIKRRELRVYYQPRPDDPRWAVLRPSVDIEEARALVEAADPRPRPFHEPSVDRRFEVLRRDGFTCRYCGRKPPEVELEVDHVIPRAAGGGDDPDNLAASCFDCNRGKRAAVGVQPPEPGAEQD